MRLFRKVDQYCRNMPRSGSKSRAVRTEHHTNSGQPASLIPNLYSLKGALQSVSVLPYVKSFFRYKIDDKGFCYVRVRKSHLHLSGRNNEWQREIVDETDWKACQGLVKQSFDAGA